MACSLRPPYLTHLRVARILNFTIPYPNGCEEDE